MPRGPRQSRRGCHVSYAASNCPASLGLGIQPPLVSLSRSLWNPYPAWPRIRILVSHLPGTTPNTGGEHYTYTLNKKNQAQRWRSSGRWLTRCSPRTLRFLGLALGSRSSQYAIRFSVFLGKVRPSRSTFYALKPGLFLGRGSGILPQLAIRTMRAYSDPRVTLLYATGQCPTNP